MIVVYLAVIHSIFYIVKSCDNLFEECAMILYMNIRSVSACLSKISFHHFKCVTMIEDAGLLSAVSSETDS